MPWSPGGAASDKLSLPERSQEDGPPKAGGRSGMFRSFVRRDRIRRGPFEFALDPLVRRELKLPEVGVGLRSNASGAQDRARG